MKGPTIRIVLDEDEFERTKQKLLELHKIVEEISTLMDTHWFTRFVWWVIKHTSGKREQDG